MIKRKEEFQKFFKEKRIRANPFTSIFVFYDDVKVVSIFNKIKRKNAQQLPASTTQMLISLTDACSRSHHNLHK